MNLKGLQLIIVSPEKEIFTDEISSVTLPGSIGSFSILPNHAPIISSLKKGTLTYVSGGAEQQIEIEGGFVEYSNGLISVTIY